MPVFAKYDGIDGESQDKQTDNFVFNSGEASTTDEKHKEWIMIESISQPVNQSSNSVPTEEITLNYEEIKWTYNKSDGDHYTEVEWTY